MKKAILTLCVILVLSLIVSLLWEACVWRFNFPLAPGIISCFSEATGEQGYDFLFYDMIATTLIVALLISALCLCKNACSAKMRDNDKGKKYLNK